MNLQPADIVLTDRGMWTSKIIKWGTQSSGEPPSKVAHVGVMFDAVDIIEALGRGVVKRSLLRAYQGKRVAIYRVKSHVMNKKMKAMVALKADELQDSVIRYSYLSIFLRCIDNLLMKIPGISKEILSPLYKPVRFSECEQFALRCFKDQGISFGGAMSPDDVWDYIHNNPKEFFCVHPLGELR